MNDQLIISITSWPPRINALLFVVLNILKQIRGLNARLVLVLSEDEFRGKELPKMLNDCIKMFNVELIWDNGNIESHKKLLPVIEKYPNNPILIIDDDKYYPQDFVKTFLNDHKAFPNDIIVGGGFFYLKPEDGKVKVLSLCKTSDDLQNQLIPNQILTTELPANGCFGQLFPANTFNDKRFFDREAMM